MKQHLAEAITAENEAVTAFNGLMAAKGKEVAALGNSIESKMQKTGTDGVSMAQMQNDLVDTKEALEGDKHFLADLEAGCSTKTAEWEKRVKTRAEELVALADTIKVLNDDDALDLFKKTLPSPNPSLI